MSATLPKDMNYKHTRHAHANRSKKKKKLIARKILAVIRERIPQGSEVTVTVYHSESE